MASENRPRFLAGIAYAFSAYGWWGIIPPLFFYALRHVPVWEVLAHRIIWSVLFLGAVLIVSGQFSNLVQALRNAKLFWLFMASTLLISINWFAYVYGVSNKEVVQTSLGYFMNPLVNVVLGMVVFREKLTPMQWLAVILAVLGVCRLTLQAESLPWIALTLAFSFGLYGMVRKFIPVNGLISLSVEILYLTPISFGYLLILMVTGNPAFYSVSWQTDMFLMLSGAVTAIPLLCFGQAALRLPLSTLGFIQYLAPTCQFLLGVFILREQSNWLDPLGLIPIWAALLVFSLDSMRRYFHRSEEVKETLEEGEGVLESS